MKEPVTVFIINFERMKNLMAKNDFKPIPDGTYEVFVTGQKEVILPTGTIGTEITFVIRNDVEQQAKGRLLWNKFWHTEKGQKVCNSFMEAAGKPNSLKFKSREEWAEWPQGKSLRIKVYQKEWTSKDGQKSGVENKISKFQPSNIGLSDDNNEFTF